MRKQRITRAIGPDTPVGAVMDGRPAVIRIFLRHRMACVGCPVARLHSIADASVAGGVDVDRLLAEIRTAMKGPP